MVEDGAHGKMSRGTWETLSCGMGPNPEDEDISSEGHDRESAGCILAKKRSNVRGAKAPYRGEAKRQESGDPLESKRFHYGRMGKEVGSPGMG